MLPMESESVFYAFFRAVVILGPKSPSSVAGHSAVGRSYMKLVEAAVAFWHVVRGTGGAFDAEWPPRMGAFWAGIKRSCVHASSEKTPLLLADMRAVCVCGVPGLARLR